MLKFHSLRIAELQPDADDAVAISLDVPVNLRSEYVGLPGQHVVLRAQLDGAETRRTYSLPETDEARFAVIRANPGMPAIPIAMTAEVTPGSSTAAITRAKTRLG